MVKEKKSLDHFKKVNVSQAVTTNCRNSSGQYTCKPKVSFNALCFVRGKLKPSTDRCNSIFLMAVKSDKWNDFLQFHSDPQRTRVKFKTQAVKERGMRVIQGLTD